MTPENKTEPSEGQTRPYFHYLIAAGSHDVASKTTIAQSLETALQNCGVQPDFAMIHISHYPMSPDTVSLQNVWRNFSEYQRKVIQMEFPALYAAIKTMMGED
jgi:hypothetical protein